MSNFLNDIYGLAAVEPPRAKDVVFGRGGFVNRNPGNREYLKIIEKYEQEYTQSRHRKFQKVLAVTILHYFRLQGVRFMKKDPKSNAWCTVKLSLCRQKISQRLRERAPFIKQTKAKEEGKTIAGDSSMLSHRSEGSIKSKISCIPLQIPVMSKTGSPIFLSALASQDKSMIQVTDTSEDEGDDLSTLSDDDTMYCAPLGITPRKMPLAVPCEKVFNNSFYPVGGEDSTITPPTKHNANNAAAETDICRFCPCKRRRTSYAIEKDDKGLNGLDGLDEFKLDALLDDGVGLDDYLQL